MILFKFKIKAKTAELNIISVSQAYKHICN